MIQLVTFDLDDTLWALEPVMRRANQALYQWLKREAPAFCARYQLQDFGHLRQEVVADCPQWRQRVSALRREVLRRGLIRAGYTADDTRRLTKGAFEYFLEARNQVELFPQSRPLLERLSRRYRLGALSNGNADLERIGLGELFEFSLSADRLGSAKPDPLMFRHMLKLTALPARAVVHIGDSLEHDVRGAQAAGMAALWLNWEGRPLPVEQPPDASVRSLEEIPDALERLGRTLS